MRQKVCLVPNRAQQVARIAREFDGREDGSVVQAPEIRIFSRWIEELSARSDLLGGTAAPASPDSSETLALWQDAVSSTRPGITDDECRALAEQASDADRLARQWALDARVSRPGRSGQFESWRNAVDQALNSRQWCTGEQWQRRLVGQLHSGRCPPALLPGSLRIAGFVELTSLEREVLDALVRAGLEVTFDSPPEGADPDLSLRCFASLAEEVSAAARWAGRMVEQGKGRVAVVVNGLESQRALVESIFSARFHPGAALALQDPQGALFHLEARVSLAEHPVIADALMLLELAGAGPRAHHEFPLISRWLLSANWAGASAERHARAKLELELRKTGRYRWSMAHVAERAGGMNGPDRPESLIRLVNKLGAPDTGQHPAMQLLDWLAAWGWPDGAGVSGSVSGICSSFLGLLERLSRQSVNSIGSCLEALRRHCAIQACPPIGGPFSPVAVLTPEQAYGHRFDAAWVANLTMQNWPPRPAGNPLLSAAALRHVPRATEEGMLEYARRLTGALRNCAPQVRFSWCNRLDDLPVSASPLIADVPTEPGPPGEGGRSVLWRAAAPLAESIPGYRGHPWLAQVRAEPGRPIESGEDGRLPRAVSVLELQSSCPLAAYLVFRLCAETPAMPRPFSDAAFLGVLVHAALERLYRPYLDRDGFPDLVEVGSAVEQVLQEPYVAVRLLPSERDALRHGLAEWLAAWLRFEGGWPAGRVAALEWRSRGRLGGFEIDVRIDRMDRLEDGRVVLMDYKTGALQGPPAWGRERPGDVQLPLYAVLLDGAEDRTPAGAVLAGVRPGGMKRYGLVDDPGRFTAGVSVPGKASGGLGKTLQDWDTALGRWRTALEGLLGEYRAGECSFRLHDESALRHAGLEVLLRREEAARWVREHGGEGNE